MISKERVEGLIKFLEFEKDLFEQSCYSSLDSSCEDEEYIVQGISNFNDTLEVVKSVLDEM